MNTATLGNLAIVDTALASIEDELPQSATFKDLANVLLAPVNIDASLSVLHLIGFTEKMPEFSGRIFLAIELKLIQYKNDISNKATDIKPIPEEHIDFLNQKSPLRGELTNIIQLLRVFREDQDLNAKTYEFGKINTLNMTLIKGYISARVGLLEGDLTRYREFAGFLKQTYQTSSQEQQEAINAVGTIISNIYKNQFNKTSTITLPAVTSTVSDLAGTLTDLSVDVRGSLAKTSTHEGLDALQKFVISRIKGLDEKSVSTRNYLMGLIQKKRESLSTPGNTDNSPIQNLSSSGLNNVMEGINKLLNDK